MTHKTTNSVKSPAELKEVTSEELNKLSEHVSETIKFLKKLEEDHNVMFLSHDPDIIEQLSPEMIGYYMKFADLIDRAYRRRTLIDQGVCTR